MELITTILSQPVLAGLFIWLKVQKTFLLVNDGLLVRRAFNMAQLGELVTWVLIAVLVLALIYLAIRFILENALPETAGVKDYSAMLSGIVWRLGVVLVLYAFLATFLYFFSNASAMILNEMEFRPRKH